MISKKKLKNRKIDSLNELRDTHVKMNVALPLSRYISATFNIGRRSWHRKCYVHFRWSSWIIWADSKWPANSEIFSWKQLDNWDQSIQHAIGVHVEIVSTENKNTEAENECSLTLSSVKQSYNFNNSKKKKQKSLDKSQLEYVCSQFASHNYLILILIQT